MNSTEDGLTSEAPRGGVKRLRGFLILCRACRKEGRQRELWRPSCEKSGDSNGVLLNKGDSFSSESRRTSAAALRLRRFSKLFSGRDVQHEARIYVTTLHRLHLVSWSWSQVRYWFPRLSAWGTERCGRVNGKPASPQRRHLQACTFLALARELAFMRISVPPPVKRLLYHTW